MCNIKNMCAQNDVKSVNGSVENCNLEEKLGEKGVDIQEARHNSTRILAASKNVEDGEMDMWWSGTPRQADHVVDRKECQFLPEWEKQQYSRSAVNSQSDGETATFLVTGMGMIRRRGAAQQTVESSQHDAAMRMPKIRVVN